MRLARAFLVGFGACLLILANPAISSAAGDDDVLAAVLRGLGAVERGGVAWMDTKHCMSCHTFTFTLWAHREARQEGLANHPEKLDKWIGWAKDEAPGKRPWFKIVQRSFAALEADGVPEPVRDKLKPLKDKSFATADDLSTPLAGILSPDEQAQHGPAILKAAAPKPTRPTSTRSDNSFSVVYRWRAPCPTRIGCWRWLAGLSGARGRFLVCGGTVAAAESAEVGDQ